MMSWGERELNTFSTASAPFRHVGVEPQRSRLRSAAMPPAARNFPKLQARTNVGGSGYIASPGLSGRTPKPTQVLMVKVITEIYWRVRQAMYARGPFSLLTLSVNRYRNELEP